MEKYMDQQENKVLSRYLGNLDKLLDQHIDRFVKRVEFAKKNDWDNVHLIEQKYLAPLDKKISALVKIILEELK